MLPFDPPENIRKRTFSGGSKEKLGRNGLKIQGNAQVLRRKN